MEIVGRHIGQHVVQVIGLLAQYDLVAALGEWLVTPLEGHETYANAKSLVDLLHLR